MAALAAAALAVLALAAQMAVTLLAAQLMHPGKLNAIHFLMMNLGLFLQMLLALCVALLVAAGQDEWAPARRRIAALTGLFFLISLLSRPHQMPGVLRYAGLFSLADQAALALGKLSPELLIMPAAAGLFLLAAVRRFSARNLAL